MVHEILKLWFVPLLERIFIRKIEGIENIPKKGPYILAANHQSHIDPFLIGAVFIQKMDKKIHFITLDKYFHIWTRPFLKALGSIEPHGAVAAAVGILKEKKVVGIFPEGARGWSEKPRKITHTGAAVMAILGRAPIVPVAMKHTFDVWPRTNKFPKFRKIVEIEFGKPIYLKYTKVPPRRVLLNELNKIMKKIDSMRSS